MNKITAHDPNAVFLSNAPKSRKHQLAAFARWLADTGAVWWQVDLRDYRAHLLAQDMAASTRAKYLEAARRQYHSAATDNMLRDYLFAQMRGDFSERKAMVDELITRIANNAAPHNTVIAQPDKRDQTDAEHPRLRFGEVLALLDVYRAADTALALRDMGVIALLAATGLRVAEACALTFDDMRQTYQERPALIVRHGKGDVQRAVVFVPEVQPVLDVFWEVAALFRLRDGLALRGFISPYHDIPTEPLSPRAVKLIVERAPAVHLGRPARLHAHLLRHAYARMLHVEFGYSVPFVAAQLGHKAQKTTELYIGPNDVRAAELNAR